MKYEEAQKRLECFLESGRPATIAIEGVWGVGKTYVCNKAIASAALSAEAITGISYVSAYYLNSLTDLRYATFSNFRSKSTHESTTFSHLLLNEAFRLAGDFVRKYSRIIRTFGVARFVDADSASLYLSQSVSKALVIIDDVERHQSALSMKSIFSHVAQLRDEQKCTVIIILNADQLGSDENQYRSEFDKFTDYHIKLSPAPRDAIRIAIPDTAEYKTLSESLEILEVVNIRVISRILSIYKDITSALPEISGPIRSNIARTCAIYGLSQFGSNQIFRDYVEKKLSAFSSSLSRKDLSVEETKISTLVLGTGINLMGGEVTAVRVAIKSGAMTADIIEMIEKETEKYPSRAKSSFHKAWEEYHSDALADEFNIVSGWLEGFTVDASRRSHSDLEGTYTTLQMLGRQLLADYILQKWIEAYKDKPEMVNPEGTWFQVAITNMAIKDALLSAHSQNVKIMSPYDIIAKIRISDEEIANLLTHDIDWFERFIEVGDGGEESFHARIKALRDLQLNSHPGVQLRNKIEEAIKRFASRSILNAVRLRGAA